MTTPKRLFSKSASLRHLAVIALLVAGSSLGLHGANDRRAHLSADLLKHQARRTVARTRVILRGSQAELSAIAARHRLQVVRKLRGGLVVVANSAELTKLSADVDQLSGDVPVRTWMTVSDQSTAADQTRAGQPGPLGIGGIPGVTGQNIGVAVLDSGIAPHAALATRVVASVSLVSGDPSANDTFGHGTHVAGIIGGNGGPAAAVTSAYTGGIAPGVKLINVRVLGADGSGLTSDVIAGIDWVIDHKTQYDIRVINMSLGHPVMEPASTDPLCQAVQRAVNAGIVVVVAAGNAGLSSNGRQILGSITSPGNSPAAITVGALNTWGTANRSDDTVATFSSRGPTAFDFAVKPDVAAPGVRIISLEANQSLLPTVHPSIHTAGTGNNAYMYLSGTSMSTPMVSGGVALLLQGSPSLTPAQVKLALQSGASYMPDGLVAAGAGSVNFWAARQIADAGFVGGVVNTVVGGLSTQPGGLSFWDAGTLSGRLSAGLGVRLLSILDAPLAWLTPSLLNYGDLNVVGAGNPLASLQPTWLEYGPLAGSAAGSITWGSSLLDENGDTILWGTSDDDTILWGTSDDTILWGTTLTSPDAR
jgi:serine protease AprX